MNRIKNNSQVNLGVVMVHRGFNAHKLTPSGEFEYVKALDWLITHSPVTISTVQVPLFPDHLKGKGLRITRELFRQLNLRVENVVVVLMLTANPLDIANKAEAFETLRNGLVQAGKLGVRTCSATSFEAWLDGTLKGLKPLKGKTLTEAIDLLVDIHVQAIKVARVCGCKVNNLDMEYLRPGEFTTFTDMKIALRVISAINRSVGFSFCRLLDDTAHAVDSGLACSTQSRVRAQATRQDEYGTCHASQPTTRGAISSVVVDEIHSMVCNADVKNILVEIFDCEGDETAPMRKHIEGYGLKTYSDINNAMVEALILVQKTLNALVEEGVLKKAD